MLHPLRSNFQVFVDSSLGILRRACVSRELGATRLQLQRGTEGLACVRSNHASTDALLVVSRCLRADFFFGLGRRRGIELLSLCGQPRPGRIELTGARQADVRGVRH